MKTDRYSTYEAKARFSEILRKVRRRQRVVITNRGKPIAQVVPFEGSEDEDDLAGRLASLEEEGLVTRHAGSLDDLRPLVRSRGALARFLQDRD
jgi:prevent-host-death family protein